MTLFGPRLVLVGHRGAGRSNPDAPENTPDSCLAASRAGATWVELDVRQAADGVLVAWHDECLADGDRVSGLPSAALRRQGVWSLQDLLDALPPGLGIDLDVKNQVEDAARHRSQTTAAKVARSAVRARRQRPVLVSSFDPALGRLAGPVAPALPLGLLTWEQIPLRESIPTACHLGFRVLAPHVDAVTPNGGALGADAAELRRQVRIAHELGLSLLVWGGGSDELPALQRLGVDAACVDDLPAARAALAARSPSHDGT